MRWIIFGIIASLAAMFLWPIVVKMGQKVGELFSNMQDPPPGEDEHLPGPGSRGDVDGLHEPKTAKGDTTPEEKG